jgi:hypothetical protein
MVLRTSCLCVALCLGAAACGGAITDDGAGPAGDAGADARVDQWVDSAANDAAPDVPADAGDADAPPANCTDPFADGAAVPCCPEDLGCATRPDGYPGYYCVKSSNNRCSCACQSGIEWCACWG